ncbi:MAG TPA: hydrogenase expression/formation C-terminal domain-containing protein [Steroidobacteraceae bacterium]|nr:hydrogenase expression/formation C-terminal domain-containing protein [Steroidobacteraceae bacterium]
MNAFSIPAIAINPALHPANGAREFVRLPEMITAFQMPLRAVGADAAALAEARSFLEELHTAARCHAFGGDQPLCRDLLTLNPHVLPLVHETLGEGEVAAVIEQPTMRLQETGFPGFWHVRNFDATGALAADVIEVAPVPAAVPEAALLGSGSRPGDKVAGPVARSVRALFTELLAASGRADGGATHVVNLTLLPVTRDDISWLVGTLGIGPVTLYSRNFGNCRITSTGLRHAWWVQYFNGMNSMILNTIEVTPVPDAALAAPADFKDSLDRLGDWLGSRE